MYKGIHRFIRSRFVVLSCMILGLLNLFYSEVQAQPTFTETTIQSSYKSYGVQISDIDGDGDLDVVTASPDQSEVAWWENTNSLGTSWTKRVIGSSLNNIRNPQVADIDGDGNVDVIAVEYGDKHIHWWDNTSGDGTSWTKNTIVSNYSSPYTIHVVDIDGDTNYDVLAAGAGDKSVVWFENSSGDGSSWTQRTVASSFQNVRSGRAADIDGDGDLDVIAGEHASNEVAWWSNTSGDGTTWTKTVVDASFGEVWGLEAADMDGDSDLDLVAIDKANKYLTWWENTAGDGSAWSKSNISTTINSPEALHLADMDGDGDTDIITSQSGDKDLDWWDNSAGDGSSWTSNELSSNFYATGIDTGDIDGDSFIDVAVTSEDATAVKWWVNNTTTGPGGVTSNLEFWLKADAGITESSNDVSAWADQSGNSYDFSDAGTSAYTFDDDGLNYNPEIINSDGSNRRMENTNSITLQTVLGQADFTSNDPNRRRNTAANSLRSPMDLYVDASGNLWVSDWLNHRVLRYDNVAAKTDGSDADGVLGQADFTSWKTNRGGTPAANTLQWPDAGLDIDANGRLWVADRWADRVVWYHNAASKADGADADGIIGQSSFTSRHGSVDDDSFNSAHDVFVDESNDYIWIADNNHHRVLRFDGSDTALGKKNSLNIAGLIDLWLMADRDAFTDREVNQPATQNDPVHVWIDQSRHKFTALADTPPVFLDGAINGYPAIRFGAQDARMRIEGGIFGQTNLDRATVWAIIEETAGLDEPEAFSLIMQDNRDTNDQESGNIGNDNMPVTASTGSTNLLLGEIDLTTGTIAEFMATFKTPSDLESQMIGTYLALKYGLPFGQNYISTTGDTLWDYSILSAYSMGLAGIGRDDALGLIQSSSKAAGNDHILSAQQPAQASSAPASPISYLQNQSFVLWGHNGDGVSIHLPTNLDDAAYRMPRTWHIRETGTVDSLQFVIPADTRAAYMLVDANNTFTNPQIIPLTYNQDTSSLSAYLNADRAAYITFAASTPYDGYGAPPAALILYQNYPNPFNPTTTIRFDLPVDAHTYLDLYDILGRRVEVLIDEDMPTGTHSFTFDASGLASGVYFYRLKVENEIRTQKMLLAK